MTEETSPTITDMPVVNINTIIGTSEDISSQEGKGLGSDGEDLRATCQVHSSDLKYKGRIWDVKQDTFVLNPPHDLPSVTLTRDYISHPGAVAIVVIDDHNRVLLVRQYRHPAAAFLWEIPAGLLDVEAESYFDAAQRELYEETDLKAQSWKVLVDFFNSPGSSTESLRIFLAQDISIVPEEKRHQRYDEEASMEYTWADVDVAVEKILAGKITNISAVTGILAYKQASGDLSTLRHANAQWPARTWLEQSGRLK